MSLSYKFSGSVFRPLCFYNRHYLSTLANEHSTSGQLRTTVCHNIAQSQTGSRSITENDSSSRILEQNILNISASDNKTLSSSSVLNFSSSQDSSSSSQSNDNEVWNFGLFFF